MEDSEKHSVGPQQLSIYSSSMYKANVHHMELYSDTRSCNNEISALNKKNLFLMDMECVKNPFLEMSQDQIEKLDEVLQSEQAKALLQETTGKLFEDSVKPVPLSNQGASEDDQNTIPNSLESIGSLSDLENLVLEQTVAAPELFAVPNDEEVVNIASDMFHEDLDDSAMELGVVLMDHSYSLNPTDTSKEDLTDDKHLSGDDTTGSIETERENTTNGRESGTQTPPVRRSQRQIEKIEREQLEKIKAENAELQRREKEEMERLKALQEAEFLEKQKEEKAKLLKELTVQTRRQKQQMEEKIKEENVEKDISDKDFKPENESKDTKFSDKKKQNIPVNDKENESEMQNKSKRTGRKKNVSESEKSINEFESNKEDKDEKNSIKSSHKENKSKGLLLKHKKRCSYTSESEQSVDLETEALVIKGNEKDIKVMQNQKVSLRKQNRVNSSQRKKSLSESEDSKIESESEEGRRNRRTKGGIENDKDKMIEQKNNKTEKGIEKEQKMQSEDSKNKKEKKNESKRYRKDSLSDEKKKVDIDDEDVRKPERRKPDNKERCKSLSISEETNNEKNLSKYGAKSDFLHDNTESNPQTSDVKCIKSKSNKSQRKGVRRESHSSSMELFEPALFSQPDVMVKIKTPDGIDKKEEKDEFLKKIEPEEEKMKDHEINKDVHKDDVEKNNELENIENELKRMEGNMLEVKNQDFSLKEEGKDCKLNNNEVMRDLNYEKLEKEIANDMHLTQKTEVLKHENISTNEKNSECLDKGTTFLQNYDGKYVEEKNISQCKENNINLDISTFHSKSNTHEILHNVLSETNRKEELKDVQKKNILTELPDQINVALKASENWKSIASSTNGKNNLNKSVPHSPDLQIESIPAKSENLSSLVFETMADIEQALQEDLHINNVTELDAQSKELKNEKALSAGKCKSIKQSVESIKPERKSPRKHQKRKQSNEENSPEKEILSNDMARNKVTKIAQSPRSKRMKTMPKRESAQNEDEITKKNDEDDTDQFSDDPDDSDWSSEDDPEKLWCICRKPHDHRFMIQCDSCQDWFHGSCVGVSRQQGRQLEKQQKEWKCPKCTKVESSKSFPAVSTSIPKAMRKTSTSEKEEIFDAKKIEKEPRRSISKDEKGKTISPGLNKEKKIVIKSEKIKEVTKLEKEKVLRGKDKVLKEKFLKLKLVIDKPVAGTENEKTISPKLEKDDSLKAEKSPSSAHVKNKNIIISKDAKVFKGIPKTKKSECIACQKPSQNNWSYCSVACLEKYAAASLKLLQEIRGPTKATEDLSSRKVVVLERHTGKLIAGANAPLENNVIAWLKEHPTYEVLRPTPPSATRKEQISQKIKEQVKKPPVPVEKKETNEGGGPEPVRLNVRKTLKAILESRCEGSDDAMVPGDEISKISVRIEEELYKLFKDTNSKYKSKYRSLMFNIKDPRNQGLFRKIVKGKLPPDRLVRMTPEELASTELAKWREKENQHVLDMIKREQLEQQHQAATAHITKKTHKGEVEIEGESIGVIEQSPQKIPTKFVEEMAESETQELLKDTTVHHRSHLFDLNCKICTGKVAPPPPDEPIPKKVRVAHSISVDLSSSALDQVEKSVSRIVEGESPPAVDTSDDPADREPSSTVSLGSPDSVNRKKTSTKVQSSVWKGFIFMQDVAKFVTSAYKVSGPTDFLSQDIPDTIQVCGRIIPDQVWEYICKIKEAGNKELIIIRFQAANEEENITYSSFYFYLNSRKRYGVVNSYSKMIKDFYILPLAAHSPVPSALLPFDGPGLDSFRPHLLLGVIVRHKTRPLSSAAQSADQPSEEIDVCEGSYTPPLENRSYTPPLPTPASPDQPAVSSSVPSYNPSRELRAAALQQQLQSDGSTPVYAPSSESKGVLKRIDDDDEEYEPSYTPPLEKMPKIEGNSAGGKDDDANKPYDPEEFMKSLGTAGNKKASQDIHSLFSGFNAAGISEIMQKLSKKSNSSEIPSSFLASLTSKEDIDKKKAILTSLTQKSNDQEKHVDSTKDITVNQDGMSPHTPERPAEIQSPSPNSSDTLDPIQCVSSSAMTSFFDLPENLQEILNTVRLKSFEQEKLEKDAKEDTDIRCFSLFSSEPHHDTDASERSVTDVDDKSSSQGGSPFPYDDNSNSVLRPSDPRIKIRTSFHDPVYCSDEPVKSSLSTMSASELLEKAQKQLEEMEAIEQAQTSQKSVIDSNSNIAGNNYDEQLHVKTWEQLKEPPPPGIDPVDLSSINVAFKGKIVGSESQITVLNHAVPQPFCTTSVIPDSHIVGPPFIPPPTPTAFPPQLPPSYPPPPQPQNIEGFPSQPPVVGIENFPPPAPPGSQPPAYPQIQASLPPEVDNQNNEPWRLWQSPGQPPTDIDWRDRPPHWEENRWGDWDHRDRSRPPRERRSSEYYQERESHVRHEREMPDWHSGRNPEEWQYDRDHPRWREREREWSDSSGGRWDGRYQENQYHRWHRGNRRGVKRDKHWRGRRRNFERRDGYYD